MIYNLIIKNGNILLNIKNLIISILQLQLYFLYSLIKNIHIINTIFCLFI